MKLWDTPNRLRRKGGGMVAEATEAVRVRSDDDGVTYFLVHDSRRVRVRFRNNGRLPASVEVATPRRGAHELRLQGVDQP
jgi:hypothetical protein